MISMMNHELSIKASKRATWSAIADEFGEIYQYSPNIIHSRLIGNTRNGVGMTRRCEFPGNQYVVERITTWKEGDTLSFEAPEISLPIKTLRSRWTLHGDDSQTVLRVETAWESKGILGYLMRPMMKRQLTRGLGQALEDIGKELERRSVSSSTSNAPVAGEPQLGVT